MLDNKEILKTIASNMHRAPKGEHQTAESFWEFDVDNEIYDVNFEEGSNCKSNMIVSKSGELVGRFAYTVAGGKKLAYYDKVYDFTTEDEKLVEKKITA